MKNNYFKPLSMLTLFWILISFCTQNTGTSTLAKGATTASKKCIIDLKITGLQPGVVQFAGTYADQNFYIDTFTIHADGSIKIKRDTLFKPGLYYVIFPGNLNIQLLLDKDQEFELSASIQDLIGTMTVTGSLDNDLYYQSLKLQLSQEKATLPLQAKAQGKPAGDPDLVAYQKVVEENKVARKNQTADFLAKHPTAFVSLFKKAGQNPEIRDIRAANGEMDMVKQASVYRSEYWDNVDLADPRMLSTPVISNKLKQYFVDLMPQHQDSIVSHANKLLRKTLVNPELFKYVSNWLLLKFEPGKTTLMDGEAVFVQVVQNFFNKENAVWLTDGDLRAIQQRANEMKGSVLNVKGQDVIAKNPQGESKSIYAIQTPYVIVYLYHTDCEHCQAETPKLAKAYPQLKSRGVSVFTIAVNTTDAEWKKFIQTYNMGAFTNVFDPTNVSVYGKYFVDNTPEIYVLNKDRKIIGKNLKVEQINAILDRDAKGEL